MPPDIGAYIRATYHQIFKGMGKASTVNDKHRRSYTKGSWYYTSPS